MEREFISASEIGQAAYCPYALYLQRKGVPQDKAVQTTIRSGNRKHTEFTRKQRQHNPMPVVYLIAFFLLVFLVISFVG